MGRAPLTAVMKASYFAELVEKGQIPKSFEEKFGSTPEKFFIATPDLKATLGERFKEVSMGRRWIIYICQIESKSAYSN